MRVVASLAQRRDCERGGQAEGEGSEIYLFDHHHYYDDLDDHDDQDDFDNISDDRIGVWLWERGRAEKYTFSTIIILIILMIMMIEMILMIMISKSND